MLRTLRKEIADGWQRQRIKVESWRPRPRIPLISYVVRRIRGPVITRRPEDALHVASSRDAGSPAGGQRSDSGCVVMGGRVPQADHRVCLGALLALDDVEFHIVAFLQGLVTVQLDRRIMDEYVWPVFTSDESVALGIVEPLNLSFVLSHRLPPSLHREECATGEKTGMKWGFATSLLD